MNSLKKTRQTNIDNLSSLDENKLFEFQKELKDSGMEVCVSCGAQTKVPRTTHIDMRHYYVEGAGQLCNDCGEKLYK